MWRWNQWLQQSIMSNNCNKMCLTPEITLSTRECHTEFHTFISPFWKWIKLGTVIKTGRLIEKSELPNYDH